MSPSRVPIHSPKIGTSFCSTCTTSTSGAAPGGAPARWLGRIASTIRPVTSRQSAPPIQSLYFESAFIFSPSSVPACDACKPISTYRPSRWNRVLRVPGTLAFERGRPQGITRWRFRNCTFVTDRLIALPPQANQTNVGHPHGRVPRRSGGLGVQSLLSRVVSLSRQTLVCALLPYLGPCSRSSWPL